MIVLNSKQKKTLAQIFQKPVPRSIRWDDVKSLLIAVGCTYTERDGSKVLFGHEVRTLHLHRPHPQREIKPYSVKLIREFLEDLGMKP